MFTIILIIYYLRVLKLFYLSKFLKIEILILTILYFLILFNPYLIILKFFEKKNA